MMWDLVHWDECAIELEWVVVELGNKSVLRRLTKDGDDNVIIYVDPAVMNVLMVQRARQELWKEQLGSRWVEQGLVFARDGYMLREDGITRSAGRRTLARSARGGGPPGRSLTFPRASAFTTGGTARSPTTWTRERTEWRSPPT